MKWTERQQQVIDSRDCNLLVAAAAGSGKTAVLVERIIRMITDPSDPVEIDKLLVVTFTNAAAAEMRERIGKGIDEKLREDPDNQFLARQKLYLQTAKICTIHSFCQNLIREHFNILEIDPSFRLGDEAELSLLKNDVAGDVLEVYYAAENEKFMRFMDSYAGKSGDDNIRSLLIGLYDYAIGSPYPESWLKKCVAAYQVDADEMDSHPMIMFAVWQMRHTAEAAIFRLKHMQQEMAEDQVLLPFYLTAGEDISVLEKIRDCADFDEIRAASAEFKRLPTLKGVKKLPEQEQRHIDEMKERFKGERTKAKEAVRKVKEEFFKLDRAEIAAQMSFIRPNAEIMTELIRSFMQQYQEAKEERNILDFDDLEHLALKLLAEFSMDEKGNASYTPTALARQLSAQYREVICDEYQDSNQVQEALLDVISGVREGRNNRFMVGDVKQSIYGFRLADASIFMEKYNTYSTDNISGGCRRIDLHQNFRSRPHVLEGINYLFSHLMRPEMGGIAYDDAAALHPGAEYPDGPDINMPEKTDILLLDYDRDIIENEDIEETKAELEARMVAGKIREITDPVTGLDVYDRDTQCCHKAGFNDIVILFRAASGWAETFVRILALENIPAQAELSTGFMDTAEIRTVISLLQVIDNARQDIPLAAVLTSPAAGLTSEEMGMIRSLTRDVPLYDACLNYPEGQPGYEKLRLFLHKLELLRESSCYMEIHELIQYIYDLTGYYDYVQAMPSGMKRKANLDRLIEKAVSFTAGSYHGLFNFVRYIEQLKKNEVDFGEAVMPSDERGRVRIISIHKSKGLEYPVVFLCGLNKQFNMSDTRGFVTHQTFGIGMDAVNADTRKKMSSVYKTFIAGQKKLDNLAEEMRILYVAMTRAKEKLILTAAVDHLDKAMLAWAMTASMGEDIPLIMLEKADSYLDWLMPCLLNTDAADVYMDHRQLAHPADRNEAGRLFDLKVRTLDSLTGEVIGETVRMAEIRDRLREGSKDAGQADDRLSIDYNWCYRWQQSVTVKSKYSVSELKKPGEETEDTQQMVEAPKEETPYVPSFMREDRDEDGGETLYTGALRGTAYHRAMELMHFAEAPETADTGWIREQLEMMTSQGRLTPEQKACIRPEDLAEMVFSPLGRRMSRADKAGLLKRETQFVMGVPASMVGSDSDNLVIVQGIIDAWFEENGEIILMDYKTDRVSFRDGEEELKHRYIRQLDYYQYALEHITHRKVVSRQIYAFTLKHAFEL